MLSPLQSDKDGLFVQFDTRSAVIARCAATERGYVVSREQGKFAGQNGQQANTYSEAACGLLFNYQYPTNVKVVGATDSGGEFYDP